MWMQNWLEVLAYMKINIRNQNRFPIISTAFAKANSTNVVGILMKLNSECDAE